MALLSSPSVAGAATERQEPDSPAPDSAGKDETTKTGFEPNSAQMPGVAPLDWLALRKRALLGIFRAAGRSFARRVDTLLNRCRKGRGKGKGGGKGYGGPMRQRLVQARAARLEAVFNKLTSPTIRGATKAPLKPTLRPPPCGPKHQP